MVYFDNAATTPVPKAVADAMYEVLTAHFGNPSSQYPIGVEMKKAVEGWRAVIAGALGCPAERLYFTSCGTESDNWAIQAALWQNRHRGRHIITTAVEHSAVLEPCKLLAQQGYEVTYLKPGRDGNVTAEQVADALREDTALVSVMLVNNETGCVFPAADIAALLREKGITCLAAALYQSQPLSAAASSYPDGVCVVIGSEGQGLTDATVEACDMAVRIPMTDRVESLNAAVAGSVLLWHFRGV